LNFTLYTKNFCGVYYSPANIMPIACAFSRGIDIVAYVDDLSAASPESSDCAGLIARSPLTEIKWNRIIDKYLFFLLPSINLIFSSEHYILCSWRSGIKKKSIGTEILGQDQI
jgi:hypothetical protein